MSCFLLVQRTGLLARPPRYTCLTPPCLPSTADSLWCFTCENQRSNWSCLKATKCSNADKHCLTTVGHAGIGTFQDPGQRITKKCSPTCPQFNINLGIASYSTTCCESFLCNLIGKPACEKLSIGRYASLTKVRPMQVAGKSLSKLGKIEDIIV
uniref:UPAR/Ly6 domain-containing protein n=1 Tax=Chelydra serpentina TaxID=8475 RepID=A0A8C3SXT0_CHESE